MFLTRKRVHTKHNKDKHRYKMTHHHGKYHRKNDSNAKHHLKKYKNESPKSLNKNHSEENPNKFNNTKHLAKNDDETRQLVTDKNFRENKTKRKQGGKIYLKNRRNHRAKPKRHDTKHGLQTKNHKQEQLHNKTKKRRTFRYLRRPKHGKTKTKGKKNSVDR